MWNLFSAVQPKVLKPSKCMKQYLLQQQADALEQIKQEANQILNTINNMLKAQVSLSSQLSTVQKSHIQTKQIQELQELVNELHQTIYTDYKKFQTSIQERDQEKSNHQEFFTQAMRSYEKKRSQLNKNIEQLQQKVQKLQLKGLKTYELNPPPNGVLNGFNKNYIDKYLSKIDQIQKTQVFLLNLLRIKQQNSSINAKPSILEKTNKISHNQNEKLHQKIKLSLNGKDNSNLYESLQDLQAQLQMILTKQEVLSEFIDKNIKKCKRKFVQLASQQKILKEAIKKTNTFKQDKKRTSTNTLINKQNSLHKISFQKRSSNNLVGNSKPQLTKTSSFFQDKQKCQSRVEQVTQSLNPSFQQKNIDIRSQIQQEQIDNNDQLPQEQNGTSQINIQKDQDDDNQMDEQGLILSENFIQACKQLITQRFIEADEQDQQLEHQDQ